MADKSAQHEDFHDRLFVAWSLWQGRHRRKLTQGELGDMVGRVSGEAVAQNTVSGWFKDVEPELADIVRVAKALEVDPGWLAFGPDSGAPAPDSPATVLAQPAPRSKRDKKRA